ncbi:MAG TPA: tetratricopeptide repeat protein [Pyrinomonadaceae bacterium]|nr:tetratricopeptide repeat protein [Pyrinomonadaceae bacterium]
MNWLRPLLMIFYAPSRAMSEARDRAPLAPAMVLALVAHVGYLLFTQWPYLAPALATHSALAILSIIFRSAGSLLLIALVLVPITAFVANLFERRASFGVVMQQEYAPLASAILYAWAAAHLIAIPLAFLANSTKFTAEVVASSMQVAEQWQKSLPPDAPPMANARLLAESFYRMLMLPFFGALTVIAVREVFRISILRAIGTTLLSGILMLFIAPILMPLFRFLSGSIFLLMLVFIFLRSYIGEAMRSHQARASFKQNLEAATLNPADASAHYNLGLIHQQRGELDEARKRFERAIEIDADEIDSHYQLGRIARTQNHLADAVGHFEQVVQRDQTHAQHEIWREIGATYLAAGQFADARDALERFLDYRRSDPQGLYLMGRALAGMGRQREAAEQMQACIEAVKTAPAYKYRTEKRWLNEAQQFLRTQS